MPRSAASRRLRVLPASARDDAAGISFDRRARRPDPCLMERRPKHERGPFRAHDLAPGDRHELSRGNAIYCAPTGGSGARGTGYGFELLDSDPAVESAGVDAGFAPSDDTLRAPDVSVGVPDQPGWIKGAPPLALEYAETNMCDRSAVGEVDAHV